MTPRATVSHQRTLWLLTPDKKWSAEAEVGGGVAVAAVGLAAAGVGLATRGHEGTLAAAMGGALVGAGLGTIIHA